MSQSSLSPLDGGGRTFIAGTAFDLSKVGYCEAEYRLSGTAVAYERVGNGLRAAEEADFATRLIVYRPTDASLFDGTVWIEWHNVSGGVDAAPGWIFTHRELVRRGAVWIGVSAQKVGVEGGDALVKMPGVSLLEVDQERYGSLRHPGDRFSYDIFTQATLSVREAASTILDGLSVERFIATGDSQSAFRLTTYVNEIDALVQAHDGFMIHARGGSAAPLDDSQDPRTAVRGDPVLFRRDLRVPVLCVEAETDLLTLGYARARQDDSDNLVVWEIAGASHADVYTFVVGSRDDGLLAVDELAKLWIPRDEIFGMRLEAPVNSGPQHYVRNAAVRHLERWVRQGVRPPPAERLEVEDDAFVADEYGIAKGGIRTPHVEVPTAVLSGIGNGGSQISFLCGRTLPFDSGRLAELYSSQDVYLERFSRATGLAVAGGFFLDDDAAEILAIAEVNSPL
jgi:Alpha/beta hydrolase domain